MEVFLRRGMSIDGTLARPVTTRRSWSQPMSSTCMYGSRSRQCGRNTRDGMGTGAFSRNGRSARSLPQRLTTGTWRTGCSTIQAASSASCGMARIRTR